MIVSEFDDDDDYYYFGNKDGINRSRVNSFNMQEGDINNPSKEEINQDYIKSRDKSSEIAMIQQYAAESIQDAYRHYIACKPSKKMVKTKSFDKLVINLAADTIKDAIAKRVKSRKLSDGIAGNSEKFSEFNVNIDNRDIDIDTVTSPLSRPFPSSDPSFDTSDSLIYNSINTNNNENLIDDISSYKVVRNKQSEDDMIHQYAAESIQDAYRRYSDCKPDLMLKRSLSFENHAIDYAQEIIKNNEIKKFTHDNEVQTYAAESIQEAYKRYNECKPAIQLKRTKSFEKLNNINKDFNNDFKNDFKNDTNSNNNNNKELIGIDANYNEFTKASSKDRLELSDVSSKCSGQKHSEMEDNSPVFPNLFSSSSKEIDNNDDNSNNNSDNNNNNQALSKDDINLNRREIPLLSIAKPSDYTFKSLQKSRSIDGEGDAPVNGRVSAISGITSNTMNTGINTTMNNTTNKDNIKYNNKDSNIKRRTSLKSSPLTSKSNRDRDKVISLDQHLVIDEAFDIALRIKSSIITLYPHEAVLLLDALGYELSAPINAWLPNKDNKDNKDDKVEIPMLLSAPLASALSAFTRDKGISPKVNNFFVSQDKAEIAVKQLSSLVRGDWIKIRSFILKLTEENEGGRPSHWTSLWVPKLFKMLQLPICSFDAPSGLDVLEVNASDLKDRYGIHPSLLQARFIVYQHCLSLLDLWWDKGIRPSDLYTSYPSIRDSTMINPLQTQVLSILLSIYVYIYPTIYVCVYLIYYLSKYPLTNTER
jgi:hypothetical protein